MKDKPQLPEIIRQPLLFLTMVGFAGAGGLMSLVTLFVVVICLWDSFNNLAYWNWISAPAIVVKQSSSERRGTPTSSRSMTSCPVIRFSDRTGKSYEVSSSCVTTYPSRRGSGPKLAYWKGKSVTVWYDPDNPANTLIAEHKPQFNPFGVINFMSVLFGSLAISLLAGAKMARAELQNPDSRQQ